MIKNLSDRIKDIPQELIKDRKEIECDFIFCLYKDPMLIPDYKNRVNNDEDIITEEGIFYYTLILGLFRDGYTTFDDMSVHLYLENKPTIKKGFEELNGYRAVHDITSLVNKDNVDAYYEKLRKSNMIIRLYLEGFNVGKDLAKLNAMTADEIYDYYLYKLSDVGVNGIEKIKIENLSEGYDSWINEVQQEKNIGFPIGSKIMNSMTFGVHTGCLSLYVGGIGQGKTSSSIPLFILPAIESGENVTILCNEQTSNDYRAMIMSTVLFSRIKGVSGMNRSSFVRGRLTDEQLSYVKRGSDYLNDLEGKINFVELSDYSAEAVKKIIVRQSKLGCRFFFFDVLKSENEASESAWAKLSETAKMLSLVAKNYEVAILATAQLASDCLNRSYLDLTSIGKSRAMAECATAVYGFRPIHNDEIGKIQPYTYIKGVNGKATESRVELDPSKHYIEMFIMKNRFGATEPQIIMEFNQSFNTIHDIGYCRATYDHFNRGGKG